MMFEHFVQSSSESQADTGDRETMDTGLAQAGTGRGLGFARRLRAVLAEGDAKPIDNDREAEQGSDTQEPTDKQQDVELPGSDSPALSHTRSHRKRPGGAYGDQTRTGYVNTFSSVS